MGILLLAFGAFTVVVLPGLVFELSLFVAAAAVARSARVARAACPAA